MSTKKRLEALEQRIGATKSWRGIHVMVDVHCQEEIDRVIAENPGRPLVLVRLGPGPYDDDEATIEADVTGNEKYGSETKSPAATNASRARRSPHARKATKHQVGAATESPPNRTDERLYTTGDDSAHWFRQE